MSLPYRYECGSCGRYDVPLGARRHFNSESLCRCGGSIYDGEDRLAAARTIPTTKGPSDAKPYDAG